MSSGDGSGGRKGVPGRETPSAKALPSSAKALWSRSARQQCPECWCLHWARGAGNEDVTGVRDLDVIFSASDLLLRTLTFFLCRQFLVSGSDSVVVMKLQGFDLTSPKDCAFGHFHVVDKAGFPFRFLEGLSH